MSASNPSNQVRLEVRTQDDAAEIYVIDAHFHLAARGLGRSQTFYLDPGVYTVKVRAGSATREEDVILGKGDKELLKEFPALKFASPAPLEDTAKTHEYHMAAASTESRNVRVQAGQGSWIFIFARDWTAPGRPPVSPEGSQHPAAGLTLTDARGNLVANFATQSECDLSQDPWAACNVQVNPGLYRLRLELPSGAILEQTVVASPGGQTQLFLLQRAYGPEPNDRRADLPGASVLLARGYGFDPNRPDMRLVELARLGLTNTRQVLPDNVVQEMLYGKFENPMLGIYGAHLLLLRQKVETEHLRTVVVNLRGLVGTHPDVEALALGLGPGESSYVFEVPPMLRRSWSLVLNASVKRPGLVPLDSLAAQVASRLWGGEPWLLWMTPAPEAPAPAVKGLRKTKEVLEASDLEATLKTQLQLVDQPKKPFTAYGFPRPSVEKALVPDPAARTVKPQLDDDTVNRLVQVLGVPRAKVEDLLEKLAEKKDQNETQGNPA